MDFNSSLFFMPLLVGGVFILAALIMLKFPPKKINALYGYRTSSSMKNQERWDFAQRYSSILMIYCGIALILVSVLGIFIEISEKNGVIVSMIFVFITIGILIWKTETALKKTFKNEK